MKKIVCILIVALMLTTAAFAEIQPYTDPEGDIAFSFDTDCFELYMDDVGDDEHMIILTGTRADWSDCYIRMHLRELDDGEAFPVLADFEEIEKGLNTKAKQSDWNGFTDVIMYEIDTADDFEQVFIVPVRDDDGEIEDILTINAFADKLEDEDAGMSRDDAISAVLDTLKVLED